MLKTQLENTDKMVGNWRLGNDSRIKEAFWPELQNVLLGRKDAKTALADAERKIARELARADGRRPGGRSGLGAYRFPRPATRLVRSRKRTRELTLVACFLLPSVIDLLPLPRAAARLERDSVVPVLVAAEARPLGRARALRGDAARTTTCSGRR